MSQSVQRKSPSKNSILDIAGRPNILFVTVCSKNRRPAFNNREAHKCLVEAWAIADHWAVGKYVLMPDHIHLFCSPSRVDRVPLNLWIKYWKTLVSKASEFQSQRDLWLKGCWDTQMRNGEHYSTQWEYAKQNPVRAGLVDEPDEWPYHGEITKLRW